jgi:hypothetical protein
MQCRKVLGKYDVILLHPEHLDLKCYQELFPGIRNMPLGNEYFEGIMAYNRLLLSEWFYEQFENYEYMLIYQLDAWVFEDKLNYWCSRGFDYIGAPDSERRDQKGLVNKLFSRVLLNGGFSLRRIKKSKQIARWYNRIWASGFLGHEDAVFSAHYNRFYPLRFFIKLPSYREALAFAFEKNPEREFKDNGGQLPFGCHAFRRYDAAFWEKHGII